MSPLRLNLCFNLRRREKPQYLHGGSIQLLQWQPQIAEAVMPRIPPLFQPNAPSHILGNASLLIIPTGEALLSLYSTCNSCWINLHILFRRVSNIEILDERFGSSAAPCTLSTPKDTTTTHILVFPTSATAQVLRHHFVIDRKLGWITVFFPVIASSLQQSQRNVGERRRPWVWIGRSRQHRRHESQRP